MLNHKERISPLELDQMEFYRIELFVKNLEEQIDKENEQHKKQQKQQEKQSKMGSSQDMMKQAQKNMPKPPNINPPKI